MFFKNSIKQFIDLEEAIKWSLVQLKKHQNQTSQNSAHAPI